MVLSSLGNYGLTIAYNGNRQTTATPKPWQPLSPKCDVPKAPTDVLQRPQLAYQKGPCRAKCAGTMGMCIPRALKKILLPSAVHLEERLTVSQSVP